MKSAIFFLAFILSYFALAQNSSAFYKQADDSFVMLVNNKSFQNNSVIGQEVINGMLPASLEVMNIHTHVKYSAVGFECVVSVKDSNEIWKFDSKQVDFHPVHCKNCCKSLSFKEVIRLMKNTDLLFVDQIQYAKSDTSFPTGFAFKVM